MLKKYVGGLGKPWKNIDPSDVIGNEHVYHKKGDNTEWLVDPNNVEIVWPIIEPQGYKLCRTSF